MVLDKLVNLGKQARASTGTLRGMYVKYIEKYPVELEGFLTPTESME